MLTVPSTPVEDNATFSITALNSRGAGFPTVSASAVYVYITLEPTLLVSRVPVVVIV